jgi:hypothetical protein
MNTGTCADFGYAGSLSFHSLVAVCLSNGKIIVIHLTKVALLAFDFVLGTRNTISRILAKKNFRFQEACSYIPRG